MRQFTYILIILFLGGCWTNDKPKGDLQQTFDSLSVKEKDITDWTFEKVKESKLVFKNGQTFETNLFELEYIGQISADNKAPYLIFSGRDCNECDANISIYIHSPSDGKLVVGNGQNRYQYPGTETDYETDSVLYISKAFYGQVLKNIKGVVWYESSLLENGKMGHSVFLLRIENGTLNDSSFVDNGKLAETINLLKKGKCKEVSGRRYSSEP